MRPSPSRCLRLLASLAGLARRARASAAAKRRSWRRARVLLELSVRRGRHRRPTSCASPSTTTRARCGRTRASPAAGALVPESATRLGTVLIQPGATQGGLRVHVRGFAGVDARRRRHARDSGGDARQVRAAARRRGPRRRRRRRRPGRDRRLPGGREPRPGRLPGRRRWRRRRWRQRRRRRRRRRLAATTAAVTSAAADDGGAMDALDCDASGGCNRAIGTACTRRRAVHVQLLRRRRLLRERLHRSVPILQPAEHRRHCACPTRKGAIPPSSARPARPATAPARCGPPTGGRKPTRPAVRRRHRVHVRLLQGRRLLQQRVRRTPAAPARPAPASTSSASPTRPSATAR